MSTFSGGPNIVTDGLVLYLDAANNQSYPRSGTKWNDLSKNSNHGTLVNGPMFNSNNGGSIVFDGVNDNIDLGDKDSFTIPTGFTISAWWKPNSYVGGNPILTKYQRSYVVGDFTGYEFVFGALGNVLYGWVYDNNTNGSRGRSIPQLSSVVPTGIWANFTYTYDGTGTYAGNKLFINGTQRDSSNLGSGTFTTIRNTLVPLNIGISNIGVGGPLKGQIASLSYYNRALSQQEILQNYNATKSRFGL